MSIWNSNIGYRLYSISIFTGSTSCEVVVFSRNTQRFLTVVLTVVLNDREISLSHAHKHYFFECSILVKLKSVLNSKKIASLIFSPPTPTWSSPCVHLCWLFRYAWLVLYENYFAETLQRICRYFLSGSMQSTASALPRPIRWLLVASLWIFCISDLPLNLHFYRQSMSRLAFISVSTAELRVASCFRPGSALQISVCYQGS